MFPNACTGPEDTGQLFKTVSIELESSKKGTVSDLFSEIKYTLIDDSDSFPLTRPYKLVITDSHLYFQDHFSNDLHVFNPVGEFHSIIKSSGDGPGEFRQIDDYMVYSDTVFILDRSLRKMLVFYKDSLIKEDKVGFNASGFTKAKNKTAFFMDNTPDPFPYNFYLIENNELAEKYLPIVKGFENMHFGLANGFVKGPSKKSFHIIPFTTQLAVFDENLLLEEIMEFDLGKNGVSPDLWIKLEMETLVAYLKENSLVESISSFYEFDSCFFLVFFQPENRLHYVILNKDFEVLKQLTDLSNDLDNMTIRGTPWSYSKNEVVQVVHSKDFHNDYVNKFKNQKVSVEQGNVHDFFQRNQEKLKNDQYVLVSLKIRDSFD